MTARCILITGAASGIGAGIAAELASAGHHLVISDVNRAAAESVAAQIRANGGSAEALALDVTSDDSVAAALQQVSRPVDVLVNNAGLQHVAPLEEFPIAKWSQARRPRCHRRSRPAPPPRPSLPCHGCRGQPLRHPPAKGR